MSACQWGLSILGGAVALWLLSAAGLAIIAHKVEASRARQWPGV